MLLNLLRTRRLWHLADQDFQSIDQQIQYRLQKQLRNPQFFLGKLAVNKIKKHPVGLAASGPG